MKKPKAVFIGTQEKINDAYSDEVKRFLYEKLDFSGECLEAERFENCDIPENELAQTEYIFSTWGMAMLTEEKVKRIFPSLKAVFYAAGTVKYFAEPFLKNGVKIFSAWGANAVPVAEITVSEIILANKGFFTSLCNGTGSGWKNHDIYKEYTGNYNANVGIIGAGMIGKLVIKMLKNYKLNVFVFDKFMSDADAEKLGVKKVNDLPELFKICKVVSNHLANNDETAGMINKSCFDNISQNSVFINTGRGRQVNENDLINALKQNEKFAAVLDVTYPEPPESDSELYNLKNVFLTPHIAGSTGNEIMRMGEYMKDEFFAFFSGEKTKYEVTEEMLKTMA